LEVLKLIPDLRVLRISPVVLGWLQNALDRFEWEECLIILAQTCRLLRCVHDLSAVKSDPYWIIKREMGGSVGVFQSATY
jgi:hypothetical protein